MKNSVNSLMLSQSATVVVSQLCFSEISLKDNNYDFNHSMQLIRITCGSAKIYIPGVHLLVPISWSGEFIRKN